ncbi:unnamed protein product [Mytilus coruscus]|uniref:Tyrosine-protein kinase ephrin type A/B receptor-like domain-containing protein n=1 Tax=Mytilus coruscus TaxID=42192 RepID=A0A6J8A6V0_MYTCO|nr:unnamed protein product [Mytilus coruscus]
MNKVCCADYEANGNDCIACPKGYTSDIGQHCKPCPKNTYGDKSLKMVTVLYYRQYLLGVESDLPLLSSFLVTYVQSSGGKTCGVYTESCDLVEGCVSIPSTTDTSMYRTTDSMTLAWDLDARTSGKSTDNRFGDLLSQICQSRTLRNETKDVCCADYEKIENDCVACLEGYTSDMGQNCKPCPKNNYGEKCGYECSCLDFEVCDNVEGCVQALSTTDSSMYVTSGK